jgi:NADH-quinone oxidoreductase subunit G
MVNIEIDGKKFEAEAGSMIIEVADANQVYIPRFCYHKKLSVAANCRMCLVEVANIPKPVPACATPVADGMVVKTQSEAAKAAQKAVMEFLLINHPLDCPICDQGGECELQDLALGYGDDVSRYSERKRVVQDKDIGPLIETELTRCIHCTRCVRFGTEVAGMRELGMLGRGEFSEIGTFVAKSVESEVSGNVIDLCPVGALTAKPSRYTARPWELEAHASVAPHDCLGSNIDVHTRRGRVIRVVPRENESINEVWISDRDRFSYQAVHSDKRLRAPMIKENGQWREVDWHTALSRVVGGINDILSKHGADALAALASPSSTTEELYLLQKWIRALGSEQVEHRLRQGDFSADSQGVTLPGLGMNVNELEQLNATLLVGSNLRMEQPIAALRLRKSTREGKVFVINQRDYQLNFRVTEKTITEPANWLAELAAVAVAAGVTDGAEALAAPVEEKHKAMAAELKDGEKTAIFLGAEAFAHPQYAQLVALCQRLAKATGATFGVFTPGANYAGGAIAGAQPNAHDHTRAGGLAAMLEKAKAYVLLNCEPGLDTLQGEAARKAMEEAELIVALTPFANGELSDYADILLPIGTFAETSGTFVNAAGQWQSFQGAVPPEGEARPAWKVLRVLANFMEMEGFDYVSSEAVLEEVKAKAVPASLQDGLWPLLQDKSVGAGITVVPVGIYGVDPLVRRAAALQATEAGKVSRGLE